MATIKDVARLAQVGVGTASRAISGRGGVSPDALARVQKAIQQLDFRPSNVARALSLKSLGMLGVYVPLFEGSFYSPILQAIDRELRAVDRHMVAANACGQGNERQKALQGVEFLMQRQCDGVFILSNDLLESDLADLYRRYPRLVLLNRQSPVLGQHAFSVDHEHAGRLAAIALLSQGHRDIAVIQGHRDAPDNHDRMRGFHAELGRHGVQVKPQHHVDGTFSFVSGYAGAEQLLAQHDQNYTAVFCANDVMAMAAITRFVQAGRRVPQDVSIIGYDDTDIAAYTAPTLTTVRIPMDKVTTNACRFLLNMCYALNLPVERDFAPHIVWRSSVAQGPHRPVDLTTVTRS
ncbi:LacI family transcriptional regulator [Rhodoferax sp. TH121]|uniref:LacI family DNA-binding transcriptional regulator n=1 Tax=Rhodoferax sp. TH121 TaxID=2022803 RepID=UPI000B96F472|nr:substrate-binding domain-containing protein [Rhodoferax sp. TH121]OYQ42084.1 LacI family transcriptional regulator [Rhodoferax sp. TH121]